MRGLSVFIADFEQRRLVPIVGSASTESIEMDSTTGGRAYTTASQCEEQTSDGVRLWSVVVDGAARLGVIAVTVGEVHDETRSLADSLAGVVAALLVTRGQCTDAYTTLRRSEKFSLAAEMQWDLLPPLSLDSGRVSVAGLIQPAYDVGGDSFDYAVNGDTLDFAVFDAVGHGLESSQLAHLAVSTYRHSRRSGYDLEATYCAIDAAIAATEGVEKFVTCILGRVDLLTGSLRWINVGHPLPLLLREGEVIELQCTPTLPAGLGGGLVECAAEQLEPGDRVFCITDGVVDSHRPGGDNFGEERLLALVAQDSATDADAAETVRRLSHCVLDHHGVLSDDTTVFVVDFHEAGEVATLPPDLGVDGGAANSVLSEVLSEFARTLVTDFPIQSILDHLVGRIVDVLPITAAGVTLISPGSGPQYVAASDPSALRFEQLQTELGQGPCTAAYESGTSVAIADLRTDGRFPTFGSRAVAEGLLAVFTFPLRDGHNQMGALDLYRTTAGPLDDWAMATAQTLADVAAAYLLNAHNREDLRESSTKALHSSLHDPLTGLPNRTLLLERLAHGIARCGRTHKVIAVLFADLDLFKSVNNSFGHHTGDELLVAVAGRLSERLRPGDTLARLSGDEFVMLCEDLDDPSQAEAIAQRVDAAFVEPFVLRTVEIAVRASVGIAFTGQSDDSPEDILRHADTAMYQAKRKGGARHGVLDPSEEQQAARRSTLNRELRSALGRSELWVAYQPIVSIPGNQIVGVEALLRWDHPTYGSVPPDVAIPLAEQSGQIAEIGRWVLQQACTDLKRWDAEAPNVSLTMAVNVSAHQLLAADFPDTIAAVLSDTNTIRDRLTLELTENIFVQDGEQAVRLLDGLKNLGVKIALDDFGTGYSSLSYLSQFPVDDVKIDRKFIAHIHRDQTRLVVEAIVGLAHSLGLGVVAEGVETAEQYDAILKMGCDSCQGFYFGRPVSFDNITSQVLAAGRTRLRPDGSS